MQQKITPFLWFDHQAEDAMNFYTSVFKDAKVISVSRYGKGGPLPEGTAFIATFEIHGQQIMALNGGPDHAGFSETFSLYVDCETQEEVDYLWGRLTEGGEPGPCGWLKDRYGLSWQIVPRMLIELMNDNDPDKARRVTEAMLKMSKIDTKILKQAYDQE